MNSDVEKFLNETINVMKTIREEMSSENIKKEIEEGINAASEKIQKAISPMDIMEVPFLIAVMEATCEELRKNVKGAGGAANDIKPYVEVQSWSK